MRHEPHLTLREYTLAAGTERQLSFAGWCFLRVQVGEGYLLSPPQPVPIAADDFLVVPPDAGPDLRASQLGPLETQFFLVQPGRLRGLLSPFERWQLTARQEQSRLPVRHFTSREQLAEQFTALSHQAGSADDLVTRCRLLALAATILVSELPEGPCLAGPSARERFDEQMRRLAEAQLAEYSLAELAEMCGCSIGHYSRLFKHRFHCSLGPKQIALRLQRAQALLRETDRQISEIARASGFPGVGAFNATFKRHFRMAPAAWRNCHPPSAAVAGGASGHCPQFR